MMFRNLIYPGFIHCFLRLLFLCRSRKQKRTLSTHKQQFLRHPPRWMLTAVCKCRLWLTAEKKSGRHIGRDVGRHNMTPPIYRPINRTDMSADKSVCLNGAYDVRDTGLSLTTFNAHLKTYLFSTAFEATAHLRHLWFLCAAYKCTYLR